ncbi:hypothetical protein GYMLUDRAFT_754114 [Collybiopsis luxurians FD-317 M1]|uniref:RING-type domain-containing protein n=1 Tax=Collybiopsis luxurians FD-317 M1 TaxID=944289 RepID=A0A0D0BQC0_9AGAR|nr:hypothetical protein GYMLUDRAFT_754114 [Collybiopsis luxurians FD-317 M1]
MQLLRVHFHPTSTCDVCLDPYSWDETSLKQPYAIPCGHIYCRACLESVQPECCPLCRQRYRRDSIKKLHMDPPPNDNENAIVQKLIMAWDDEVEVVNVLEEVDRWLDRTEVSFYIAGPELILTIFKSAALQQLKKTQAEFQKLKARKSDDKFRIRKLESSLTHLQRSTVNDRDLGLAMEASYHTTIEGLETMLAQSQSEVQSLRNKLARLEFNNPRKDKGKGKARDNNYTPENDALRRNPLPAPPAAIPLERYATLAGDTRSSSAEAEQVAAAIEASLYDRRGRDGYSSDIGPSSSGAGPSRARTNGVHTNGHGHMDHSQHYYEPPQPHPLASSMSRPRRSSRPEALPIVLDAAVSQAQQHASRSSPSRRNKIVPGAVDEDKVYVAPPVSNLIGSYTTYVNEYAALPGPATAPVEDSHRRRHRHKSKSKSRSHRREERPERREEIAGVTGLGLIDESAEERRRDDPKTAFVNGYVEGLNSGFEYGAARGVGYAPASAPIPRGRSNAAPEPAIPSAPVAPHEAPGPRPQSSRRNTTQNVSVEGLADRLRGLMEDPSASRPQVVATAADNRASTVSNEIATWGTVTSASSRRQSNASDVFANLRSFPTHGRQSSRSSITSEIPVGDPRAFLPVVPPTAAAENGPSRSDGRNEAFGAAIVDPMSAVPLNSLPGMANSYPQPNSSGVIYHTNSETPVASAPSRTVHRRADQSAGPASNTRPANHRLSSVPASQTGDINDHRNNRHTRDNRPQPLRMESMPFPGVPAPAPTTNSTNNHGHGQAPYPNGLGTSAYTSNNPLPTLPNFGFDPVSQGSAPPRPPLHEVVSAPAVPHASHASRAGSGPSQTSNLHNNYGGHNSMTPVARDVDANALGLELDSGEEEEMNNRNGYGYGYDSIPAFAAPTPRASHGLFLRSFSYDPTEGDTLYR